VGADIRDRGGRHGVALATTYVDEAERAARVLVLADGRQLLAGAPEEIVAAMPAPSGWQIGRSTARSWRCGSSWRTWIEGGGDAAKAGAATVGAAAVRAAGAQRVEPALEDALIVAELQATGREGAPDPSYCRPRSHEHTRTLARP